ncbi:MAG: SgcJ/EcaC family oxidoreductase, partial [Candidatus Bathyarchaeota archaeon]
MKKLISISTIPVLALALLLVLGTVLADDAAIEAQKSAQSLTGTTAYDFFGADDPPTVDAEGRVLCWKGSISGDIEGVILWWFDMDRFVTIGQVSHWVDRWEIWSDDPLENPEEAVLLLAGDEAGTTTAPPGEDGFWWGKGIVTEASAEFEDWIGRQMYDGGNVTWAAPGLPDCGEGTFRINLVVDFNGDGKVDNTDISIIAGYWNTGEPLCDISPTHLGDGIVDVHDLLVLTEYLAKADVEADIAAINELWHQYDIATTTGDLELYVSLWDDDGISMGPDAPPTIGIEQIQASMEGFFAVFNLEGIPIVVEEVKVLGDWAFTRVAFRISVTPKGQPAASPRSGKALSILKRQAYGSWKVYIDCWRYDAPPPVE